MPKTGVDVLVKVDGQIVGGQRGATFNTEISTIDATHKQTAGWAYNIAGQGSWSIDCDGIVLSGDDSDEQRTSLLKLHQLYKSKEAVEVVFDDPTGLSYSGQAFMTSLPIEAPMDDVMTYTTAFSGQGEYEIEETGGVEQQSASTFGAQTLSSGALDKSSTNDQIKSELDKLGVNYTTSDTKDDLLKLYGDATRK